MTSVALKIARKKARTIAYLPPRGLGKPLFFTLRSETDQCILPDQSIIAAHADSPDGLVDVITFVITTVNQRFHYVGNILETVHTQGLDACKALTGSQKRGIAFASCTPGSCARS